MIVINLLILAVYTIFLRVSYGSNYNKEYAFLLDAFLIGCHVVLCLIIAIFTRPREFLLSAGLVLLIGFATCTIGIN